MVGHCMRLLLGSNSSGSCCCAPLLLCADLLLDTTLHHLPHAGYCCKPNFTEAWHAQNAGTFRMHAAGVLSWVHAFDRTGALLGHFTVAQSTFSADWQSVQNPDVHFMMQTRQHGLR